MTMDFQGKKVTHDFLSLYSNNSSFQHQDPSPTNPSQGFYLTTRDFLRPLDRPETGGGVAGDGGGAAAASVGPAAVERHVLPGERHVLPGGVGTYSICHVAGDWTGGAAVKAKPEPDYGYEGRENPVSKAHWSSPLFSSGADSGVFGPISAAPVAGAGAKAARHRPAPEKSRFMDAAPARSSMGFDDEDDDEEEFGRREGSSGRKDLSIKVEGKGSGSDQRPNTPRSKHSATEQRRRSKINDRFQILRELIPHSDQKRDKASFLLEVIEYIRFLQEKVQKFEASCPEWNQESSKLMPWVKVYFRSFWKNAQNNSHAAGDGFADPSQVLKNGYSPSAYIYPGCPIPVTPACVSSANAAEADLSASASYKTTDAATGFKSLEKRASQDQYLWSTPLGPADCTITSEALNEHEELTIDEGTMSVSTAYSQGVLNAITQAMQSSGVDLSQASISVQINLGKRAISTRDAVTTTAFSAMDLEEPTAAHEAVGHSRVGSIGEESSQAIKRHRRENS